MTNPPAPPVHDLFIIGGGINGCGIARDAAGRGLSVYLAEMNDLASGTSCASTKLIHGGLRYLEHYEFRLVRKALLEREVLWGLAPHIIRPLRFVLPHHTGLRPAWLLRLGLFLYDHLGARKRLPPTATLDMRTDAAGEPLKPLFTKAFEYSDCWVDDARLVVLNAVDAAERGASINPRTRVTGAERADGLWRVGVEGRGGPRTIQARLLINAAGPWVDEALNLTAPGGCNARNIRLVQGSHIVVNKLFDHGRSYMFQNADERIIFAIPYEREFTLIGTTDLDFDGRPGDAEISAAEIDYLCAAASEYFARPITTADVVWTYSGVRPLFDDGASKAQEATRDYVLRQDGSDGAPKRIDIFGGKITTYRQLAEEVLALVGEALGTSDDRWTGTAPLPGGDFAIDAYETTLAALKAGYPFLEDAHAERLFRQYGTRTGELLGDASSAADLGRVFGGDLSEREVRYLVDREWAREASDILWRRTKCGLRLSADQSRALDDYLAEHWQAIATPSTAGC